jgi:alpha-beta hydrolase superfamily lysophospholipase
MDSDRQIMKVIEPIQSTVSEIPWTRSVAAGSLVVGAILLFTGRRKSALAVAAAGAAVALLESPELVREAWNAMPKLVRTGQDFLSRVEDFVDELGKQGVRLKKVVGGD